MKITVKRVYDEPEPGDGKRILVDRLWPRGLSKDKAQVDAWPKDVAPSDELRKWYHQNLGQWEEFRKRYYAELDGRPEAVGELRKILESGGADGVTFLYSSKDKETNNAVVLKDYVSEV
ncbi:MAG: DUF488 family protein [Alkalispirochaeta sp.]|jgi:uncharacterized protein YeaO (DUF488 family)